MTEAADTAAQRDRSPAFPVISLETAITRLIEFEGHYKRSAAPADKVGEAWGIKTKAYADRMAAALRYFGLLEYQGAGKDRSVILSEDGRNYLKAQQDETKAVIVKAAALRPKQIAKCWGDWGADRPAEGVCIDELVRKSGFSVTGARDFLKVYDATISFAGLTESDKVDPDLAAGGDEDEGETSVKGHVIPPPPPVVQGKVRLMAGERELTTGLLAKDASFRLIVTGEIGVKEIERLIKKLELDKEILAEQDEIKVEDL
jgi:hypothetical protein